ncbi:MAG: NifB/NifX family molybdenum-iron cluster-binding protein [Candidatus Lokiarchaeota archaeon]
MNEVIAIPSFGNGGLNEIFNPRFGRCNSFTFITLEEGKIEEVKGIKNSAVDAMGGAGIQAAQIVGNHGATGVVVGFLGPNAAQALSSLKLKLFQAPNQEMKVKQIIEQYLSGQLKEISGANVSSHYGMGGGGRGGGRGMGVQRGNSENIGRFRGRNRD